MARSHRDKSRRQVLLLERFKICGLTLLLLDGVRAIPSLANHYHLHPFTFAVGSEKTLPSFSLRNFRRNGCGTPLSKLKAANPEVEDQVEPSSIFRGDDTMAKRLDPSHQYGFNDSAFLTLAAHVTNCLIKSDLKRASGFDGSSTGWTSWIEDSSAFRLQQCIDKISLTQLNLMDQEIDSSQSNANSANLQSKRDEIQRWTRWLKMSPEPLIVELSEELRVHVNETLQNDKKCDLLLKQMDTTRDAMLQRIGCRLISLPSGGTLPHNLQTPPGAMVYGKLLYGGVTRYRLIGSSTTQVKSSGGGRRRVGERRAVCESNENTASTPSGWLQYGGPERSYDAMDMGPCLLMELTMLPTGLEVDLLLLDDPKLQQLVLRNFKWKPDDMFQFLQDPVEQPTGGELSNVNHNGTKSDSTSSLSGGLENVLGQRVGGLQPQLEEIVRRVLDGRVIRSASSSAADDVQGGSNSGNQDELLRKEMEGLLELGLHPVRGLLLHGPPGCGKTQLAREISLLLDARPPKIIAAPELLDRWVGGSERLVRDLFADAEAELNACNGDSTQSALHVVVIDEIDAVFRRRSASDGSSEVTRASAVNQILSKLDGIHALSNVLVVGMTNRKELLDPALLRPGRLEVHVRIPLPDQEGRREILRIHFDALRRRGRLSIPLCEALDGSERAPSDSDSNILLQGSTKWTAFRRRVEKRTSMTRKLRIRDLAADEWTGGFSGADIAGLVRSAGSFALARARNQGEGEGVESLYVTLGDVYQALQEANCIIK